MRTLFQAAVVVLSTVFVGISYNWFYIPHHLVSGGVGGLALLVGQLTGLSVGLQVFLYNIPILWWAWRDLGRKFLVLTMVGIGAMSLTVGLIPTGIAIPNDPLLNSIFGGLINGLGVGLAIRAGGSMGGTDVAGVAFNRRFSLPMGDVMMAFNGVIVGLAGLLQANLNTVLYTIVAMFVSTRMIDLVTTGTVKKTVMLVTDKAEEIAAKVNSEMGRGVTILDGRGAYSHAPRNVILCVVTRMEIAQVRELAQAIDDHAFFVVLDTDEVVGRFRAYNVLKRSTTPID